MISEDIAITNAHCVPAEIRKNGSSCEGTMWVSFAAAQGLPARVIRCAQVIEVSFGAENDSPYTDFVTADYAFIRLKRSPGRGTLKLSFDKVNKDDTASMFRVNPATDYLGVKGRLNRLECAVDTIHATTAEFRNCPIVHGNSGSPVLIGGTVRGVTYASNAVTGQGAMTLIAPIEKKIRSFISRLP